MLRRSLCLGAALVLTAVPTTHAACVATGSGIVTDSWCNLNCIEANGGGTESCNSLCACDGADGEAVTSGCQAVSCTGTPPATDSWCLASCCAGVCDASMCTCQDSNGNTITFPQTATKTPYYSVCPSLTDLYCTDTCAVGNCQTQCCKTMPITGITPTPEPYVSICPDVTDEYCLSACNTIHAVGSKNPGCSARCCSGQFITTAVQFYSLCDTLTDMWCTENCAMAFCTEAPILGCCTNVPDVEVFYYAMDVDHTSGIGDGNYITTDSYCREACLMSSTRMFTSSSQVFGTCSINDCSANAYFTVNGVVGSDANIKRNIVFLGMSALSVPMYAFQYTQEWCDSEGCNADNTYVGTMAQDLVGMGREDAIVILEDGHMGVDYSRLDVPFARIV